MLHPGRSHRRRLRECRGLVPLALATAALACGKSEAVARTWPAGTVLAMNGVPILLDDVDEVASSVAMVDPSVTLPQLRRIALTNVIFPKIAAQGIDPAKRVEMQARAEEWRVTLAAADTSGARAKSVEAAEQDPPDAASSGAAAPVEREAKGNYRMLGVEVWRAAFDLEPGQWSPVIETAGAFHILSVVERGDASRPASLGFTLRMFDFPYLEPPATELVNQAIDRSKLVFVDESWRDFVPTLWQYRMGHRSP